MYMCHFTFCCSHGFRLLCRTTTVNDYWWWCNIQFYAAVLNSIQLSFFLLTCMNLKKKKIVHCVKIYMYNGTKKKIRTEIRSNRRFSGKKDGNCQLFWERDIFVFFIYIINNDDKEEKEAWAEWDDLLEKEFLYFPDVYVKADPAVSCQSQCVWPSSFMHLTCLSTGDDLFVSIWLSVRIIRMNNRNTNYSSVNT